MNNPTVKPGIMSGKKKLTMFLATFITALVNTYVADPAQAESLTALIAQYLPTLVVLAGSVFGVNREAKVDLEREKTKQTQAATPSPRVADAVEIVEMQSFEPFDAESFDRQVKARAAVYLAVNPITEFQAAADKGRVTRCRHIDQAHSYWSYLLKKALAAFDCKFGFPYAEAEQHLTQGGCTYPDLKYMALQLSDPHYRVLLELTRTRRKSDDLQELDNDMIDWTAGRWTLYGIGESARLLITTALSP